MAKRLDDTEDRRPGDRRPRRGRTELEHRHPEVETAEYEAERPARQLTGLPKLVVSTAAVAVSLYALFWVVRPQPAQPYRTTFLAITLAMTLLAYRPLARGRAASDEEREAGADNPGPLDWALAAAALVSLLYPLLVFDEFARRVVRPTGLDVLLGVVAVLLVLEATRRTVGWVLPAICLGFVAYAAFGGLLPFGWELGHKGYDLERLVGQSYMGIEGIFGVPLDVAATYIVLFTIYGAVLEYSGAGRFFIDVSFAAFGTRSAAAPGRTATLAGFLLGTVSGSGVATTVTLGSVAWPVLRRAGYPPNPGGGVLSAAGIGAILSPPTLGAAAFIIAEFLEISYLQVLLFATIPTLLYYLGIILAIEMDSRRYRTHGVEVDTKPLGWLLLRFGYYFSSLILIVVFMAVGLSPFRAVLYATIVAFLLGFLRRETRWTPRRVFDCLAAGTLGVLPVVATCAAAGVIVAVVSLTGLGLKASSLIVGAAGGIRGPCRDLLGRRGARPGAGRAGDGVVHHLGGDRRPGPDRARGRRGSRLHVHLLLRRPVRGEPADGAVVGGGGRHHRRGRVQDDDADAALHPAGVPGPLRLRAQPQRRGAAAPGADPRRRLDAGRLGGGGGRPGRGHRRVAARPGPAARAGPGRAGAPCSCSTWSP